MGIALPPVISASGVTASPVPRPAKAAGDAQQQQPSDAPIAAGGEADGGSSLFASPMHSPLIQPAVAPGSNKQQQQQPTSSLDLLELGPNAFSTTTSTA